MINYMIIAVVGLFSGICASLGIGGGFILLLYFSAFASMPQKEAQLLNLIFFLPIAIFSLFFHIRHHLINYKAVWPALIGGAVGVFAGVLIASALTNEWLAKLFAVFILLIGIKELFTRTEKGKGNYALQGPKAK